MQIKETAFDGLLELTPKIFGDERGWFYEFYKESGLGQYGPGRRFPQDNLSFSRKGVIRGLHFQLPPHEQAKLVTVLSGKVLDVVVDLRKNSKTFGQVYQCLLDSTERKMLLVPEGFAHGFAALEDSLFYYKCSKAFHQPAESGIRWDDPDLNIGWPVLAPVISAKDKLLPAFKDFKKAYHGGLPSV